MTAEEIAVHKLDPDMRDTAKRLNPYFIKKLGAYPFGAPRLDGEDPASDRFAYLVAEFQAKSGLEVDGVYGPKTHIRFSHAKAAAVGDSLIVGGKKVKVPFPVVDWREPMGMSFYDFPGCYRMRTKRPDLVVLHWDVCNSSQSCFQTLVERGLSVHLMLDVDGTVYQALDLLTATAYHANSREIDGPENARSVGIEINNPVVLGYSRSGCDRPIATNQLVANGSANETCDHVDFTSLQKRRVVEVCEAVCASLDIPRVFPDSPNLLQHVPAGVVGHYHLNSQKRDPGFTLWNSLEASGFVAKNVASKW